MIDKQFPKLLEVEYSFNLGGHNSLKFVDGRLFFFSEADSHLSEKNEYITMVSIPEENKWERFWDDLNQFGIWDWEQCHWPGEVEENSSGDGDHEEDSSCQGDHEEEDCHCEDDNCECGSQNEGIPTEENIPQEDNILTDGDIWQVKILHGQNSIFCKSWDLEERSADEFFKAMGKLAGVDVTEPFVDLSKRLIAD
ncbi:hypothetical protein [Methanobacterium sp.]|uniref:hypothetical protein n=1 Tax=Methanobacterium sp. TaxID=2164 RepID=UPI0025EC9BD4|nr:hypothetical protein [Methanobacterium sp.]MBI5458178.1 hypothetical protein [Methanobacterium sp.]